MSNALENKFDTLVVALKTDLRNLEPTIATSLRALIVALRPDIIEARRAGASWRAIAKAFQARDIAAEPDTVRIYTKLAAPTRAARRRPPPRDPQSRTSAPIGSVPSTVHPIERAAPSDGSKVARHVE